MAAKVNIAIRCRPFLAHEEQDDIILVNGHDKEEQGFVSVSNPRDMRERFKFSFKSCWDQTSNQDSIFTRDVRPILEHVLEGYTACIFCYGVTSSGKTHTMQGSPSEPGIIPRVVQYFFHSSFGEQRNGVQVAVSYMEIYKDEVYDLFVDRQEGVKLPVREAGGQIFVANLTETMVASPHAFDQMFAVACKNRSTGATLLNRASSRSHAILAIRVRVSRVDGTVTEGKINLIDLAGSENNKLTGNDPSRMAESSAINRSLSVLGQVVDALNRNLTRVPYRDCKLTRILQPFLGGNGMSLLICNIAPGGKFRQDTLNTLNFANRTMEVENRPVRAPITKAPTQLPRPGHQRRYSDLPRPRSSLGHVPPEPVSRPQPPRPRTSMLPVPPTPAARADRHRRTSSTSMPPPPVPVGRPTAGGRRVSGISGSASLPGAHMRRLSTISGSASHPIVRAPTLSSIYEPEPQPELENESEIETEREPDPPVPSISEEDIQRQIAEAVEREVARQVEDRMAALAHERAVQEEKRERERQEWEEKVKEAEALRERVRELEESAAKTILASAANTELNSLAPTDPVSAVGPKLASVVNADFESAVDATLPSAASVREDAQDISQILPPAENKKVAQALVAMARVAHDRGDLGKALETYMRAATYVPSNKKLQVRIEEVRCAIEQGKTPQYFKRGRSARPDINKAPSGDVFYVPPKRNKRMRPTKFPKTPGAYDADEESENMSPPRELEHVGSLITMTLDYARGALTFEKKRKANNGAAFPTASSECDGETETAGPAGNLAEFGKIVPSKRIPFGQIENLQNVAHLSAQDSGIPLNEEE